MTAFLNKLAWSFRPSLLVTSTTVTVIIATLSLGNWQTHRAQAKLKLQQQIDALQQEPFLTLNSQLVNAKEVEFHSVAVRGQFADQYTVFLDNKILNGVVGYHVLTPLKIGNSDKYVLVNRGWVKAGNKREQLPHVNPVKDPVQIEGTALIPSTKFLQLSSKGIEGIVWQNLSLERYQQWSGLTLQPILIQQTNDVGDGLLKKWDRPDVGVDKHRGYALTWYSFAILAFILYISLNVKRGRN